MILSFQCVGFQGLYFGHHAGREVDLPAIGLDIKDIVIKPDRAETAGPPLSANRHPEFQGVGVGLHELRRPAIFAIPAGRITLALPARPAILYSLGV